MSRVPLNFATFHFLPKVLLSEFELTLNHVNYVIRIVCDKDLDAAVPLMNQEHRRLLQHCAFLCLSSVLSSTTDLLKRHFVKEPYHTSILTGEGWVMELLAGHPERICCELGMHRHVFLELQAKLHSIGYRDSKHVSLEEQLAIFLYTCVTGLSIWHVGEQFQRLNSTVSQ